MKKLKYNYFINMIKYENQVLHKIIRRNDEKPVSIEMQEIMELIKKKEGREKKAALLYDGYKKGTIKIAEDLISRNKNLDALEQVTQIAIHDLIVNVMELDYAVVFEQLILIANNEEFNTKVMQNKKEILEISMAHPDLRNTEDQKFELLHSFADLTSEYYMKAQLQIPQAAHVILQKVFDDLESQR